MRGEEEGGGERSREEGERSRCERRGVEMRGDE